MNEEHTSVYNNPTFPGYLYTKLAWNINVSEDERERDTHSVKIHYRRKHIHFSNVDV